MQNPIISHIYPLHIQMLWLIKSNGYYIFRMQFGCCRESFNGTANVAVPSDVSHRPHEKLKNSTVSNVIQNSNNRFLNKLLAESTSSWCFSLKFGILGFPEVTLSFRGNCSTFGFCFSSAFKCCSFLQQFKANHFQII